jgi:hypothetical protein
MRSLLMGVALVAGPGIPSMLGTVAAHSVRPYAALSAEQIADLKAGEA